MPNKEIPAHIQRMHEESNELNDKIVKLETFILRNPFFKGLDENKQRLMRQQHDAMQTYSTILSERISLESLA
ncbi:hypothetical protein IFU37_014830 [Pantoea agglomerans]|uniref:crAss001_48 related protein n=1 Tax=Enterobacter agglomerans TaxID=549 RepID=UPI00177AEE76|nr:hypothetical protein [Pantoea agglomerans]WVL88883.1 hypothetical protein IFU37_014830 [Pantoea agglomerans]